MFKAPSYDGHDRRSLQPGGVTDDLCYRLEAATSRLEDIACSTITQDGSQSTQSAVKAVGGNDPTQAIASQTGADVDGSSSSLPTPTPASASEATTSAPLRAFDYLVDNELKAFEDLGKQIGGPVAEQVS